MDAAVTESRLIDPAWPRYSARPFPLYRFLPGTTPHPRRDPRGHSFGQPEPQPSAFPPEEWHKSEDYLYGIDLFNNAYWWECHEVFEGLWHAVGHDTEQGNFFQGLVQLAAANLKRFLGNETAAQKLLRNAQSRFLRLPSRYAGICVSELLTEHHASVGNPNRRPSLIRLSWES